MRRPEPAGAAQRPPAAATNRHLKGSSRLPDQQPICYELRSPKSIFELKATMRICRSTFVANGRARPPTPAPPQPRCGHCASMHAPAPPPLSGAVAVRDDAEPEPAGAAWKEDEEGEPSSSQIDLMAAAH